MKVGYQITTRVVKTTSEPHIFPQTQQLSFLATWHTPISFSYYYSSSPPRNMYLWNLLRSFRRFSFASWRPSRIHDGIVKSSIRYGQYLLFFNPGTLRASGRCLTGTGYTNSCSASRGCRDSAWYVRYSNSKFGGWVSFAFPRWGM